MRLCAIVASDGHRSGVVFDVPDSFYISLAPRSSYIAFGELLTVCLIYRHFAEVGRCASIVVFVDNIGVVHMLVNGVSRDLELGAIVSAANFRFAELDAVNWWEYVSSASNPAAGGSRVGVACPLAVALCIPSTSVEFT